MLNINDEDQEDLFRILESTTFSDSCEEDFSSSFDSDYQSTETSDSPNIKIGCRDSCCNIVNVLSKPNKTINVLTKSEEQENLLINLISQIDNSELKEEYLKKLKKTLIKDQNDKRPKSKISLDETLERFNKKKSKELTVNELQHEIAIIKEIIELKNEFKNIKNDNFNLKQELLLLKIDKQLDDQRTNNEPDEQGKDDASTQQVPLSGNASTDNKLNLINKLLSPKWFSKVKIVVCHEYEFNVIAMIDSGVDMNCIQEGMIPSKYYEKSTEKLFSANGTQMKIKFELNNAHVCHENVCLYILHS